MRACHRQSLLVGALVLGACSASGPPPADTRDGGGAGDLGVDGQSACALDAALPLRILPERFTLFDSTTVACPTPPSSVQLLNEGPATLTVEGVSVSPAEVRISALALPVALEPGTALAVPLVYETAKEGQVTAELTVRTDAGCRSFELRAISGPSPAGIADPQALHFGNVAAGARVSREITFHNLGQDASEYTSFSATPPFVIDNPPTEPFRFGEPCGQLTLRITLDAPTEPGPLEGGLRYEGRSDGYIGVVGIPLYATVTRL